MTPYWEAPGITLYRADALELLAELEPGSVDAVVTDPPYGIAFWHNGLGLNANFRGTASTASEPITGDDKDFDPEPLLKFGNVILWGADHYAMRLPHGRWLAWDKLAGLGSYDTFSDVEFAWHSHRGAARMFSHRWKGICRRKLADDGVSKQHTSQKPVALMRWCIEQTHVPAGGIVLDPYMGSGSTGVAAVQLGCRFVGCDIELRWVEHTRKRLERVLAQPCLPLEEPPRKPKRGAERVLLDVAPDERKAQPERMHEVEE